MTTTNDLLPGFAEDVALPRYRWTVGPYLAAWEAGAIDDRTELIDGDLVPMTPPSPWHGRRNVELAFLMRTDGYLLTQESLVLSDTFAPNPDLWVRSVAAAPREALTERMVAWDPADVALVVELSDATRSKDLGVKAARYAAAGIACYWVVTLRQVFVHTDPEDGVYRVQAYDPGQQVPYLDRTLSVDDVIGLS